MCTRKVITSLFFRSFHVQKCPVIARNKDYIPDSDHGFYLFQKKLLAKLLLHSERWRVPFPEIAPLQKTQAVFEEAYLLKEDPDTRSKRTVRQHREIRNRYEKQLRSFIMHRLYYTKAVTAGDRISLGLPVRKTKYSKRPDITEPPVVTLHCMGNGRVQLICRTHAKRKPSMHAQARSVELRYKTGRVKPEDVQHCRNVFYSSRSVFTIMLPPGDIGKQFWCFARWVHYSGEEKNSPWCRRTDGIVV